MFADWSGSHDFRRSPRLKEMLDMLNELFTRFDESAHQNRSREDQDHWRRVHGSRGTAYALR